MTRRSLPCLRKYLRRHECGRRVSLCTGLSSAQVAQFLQTENGFREDSFAHPGFGLTMAPGMACGAPVIASENTGGPDLFAEGIEGFMVPIRRQFANSSQPANDPHLQQRMSEAALRRVQHLGGWKDYRRQHAAFLVELTAKISGKIALLDEIL